MVWYSCFFYAVVWQGGLCGGTIPHFVRQRTRLGRHQDVGYCFSCNSSCIWMAFLWASPGDRRKYALFFAIAGTKEASVLRALAANLSGKRLSCWWVSVNLVRLSAMQAQRCLGGSWVLWLWVRWQWVLGGWWVLWLWVLWQWVLWLWWWVFHVCMCLQENPLLSPTFLLQLQPVHCFE